MANTLNLIPPARYSLIIAAFSLMLMAPAFILGAGGVDLHAQSLWVRHFSAQFWQGNYYPRWLNNMFAGDGSPLFFYYPPLTYFITVFFTGLRSWDVFGYYPIAASALLAAIASGVTFYLWAMEETRSAKAALLGALLYIAAPNHLAVNFYELLLFSSVWAYVWIPLLMLFAKRIGERRPYGIAGFALALFLLIMTNVPMTVMFGPVAVLYGMLRSPKEPIGRRIAAMGLAIGLGFGLSAIYLLPAVSYQSFANVDLHWREVGSGKIWVGSEFFFGFDEEYHSLTTLYYLATFLLVILYFRMASGMDRRFFLTVSLAALCMMLPQTRWVWEHISLLRLIQFPERLFAITSLCMAILASFAFARSRLLTCCVLLVCVIATMGVAHASRVTLTSYRAAKPLMYEHYLLSIDQYANYLTTPNLIERYSFDGLKKIKADNIHEIKVLRGEATINIEKWQPREIVFLYHASRPSLLRIRQFDFPGFRAFDGDNELEVMRDSDTGEMMISLPAGSGSVELSLTELLPEQLGKVISVMFAALVLLSVLIDARRQRNMLSNTLPAGL